jgi:hypothetical protein
MISGLLFGDEAGTMTGEFLRVARRVASRTSMVEGEEA